MPCKSIDEAVIETYSKGDNFVTKITKYCQFPALRCYQYGEFVGVVSFFGHLPVLPNSKNEAHTTEFSTADRREVFSG